MIILTNSKILDTRQIKYIKLCMSGVITDDPCISFIYEFGDYIDRAIEINFADYETAKAAFEAMQTAFIESVELFDMRR